MGKKKICCGGFEIGDGLELNGKQLNVVGGGGSQSDYNQNDPDAVDYIKNRPGAYDKFFEPVNITWDGNTEGKTSVALDANTAFYRISSDTPIAEQLIGGQMTLVNGETIELTDEIVGLKDDVISVTEACVIVLKEGTHNGIEFPLTGTYFFRLYNDESKEYLYITSLTSPGGNVQIKIPEKYLDVVTKKEVNTVRGTASTALTTANTANSKATTAQTTADTATDAIQKASLLTFSFTFDKVTSGRETFRYNALDYYKISDFNVKEASVISFDVTRADGKKSTYKNVGYNCVEYGYFIIVNSPGVCYFEISGPTHSFEAPSAGLYAGYEDGNNAVTAGTGIFNITRISDREIILSSTPDTTRKFRITVDNTGALKATEFKY